MAAPTFYEMWVECLKPVSAPICARCGTLAHRPSFRAYRPSLWGGWICPNCPGKFSPAPVRHRTLHYLFTKFRARPWLFTLFPLLGLIVGLAMIIGGWLIEGMPAVAKFLLATLGLIITLFYSWMLFWFARKRLLGEWPAFCDLMHEKYLDAGPGT